MLTQLILVSVIGFAGMFIRGLTGFGSALVMTPLMLFFFDIQTSVIAINLVEIAAVFSVTMNARHDIDRQYLKILLPITIVGIAIGSFFLISFNLQILKQIFGVLTVIFSVRIFINLRSAFSRQKKWSFAWGYLSGALGGILGGIFGTPGPPITIYLENQIDSQTVLRATLLIYFLALDVIRIIVYGCSGIVSLDMLKLAAFMLPASLAGSYCGQFINLRINDKVFRALVAVLLAITGVLLALGK
ncbi:MAG: hypothetical protein B6I22_12010 [Desulfobacteraceae bacterium 4572_123]|nr:MAG: hypothetical protein B6I22_12010 [Desulfobacteraceae bacterium 4572_123]